MKILLTIVAVITLIIALGASVVTFARVKKGAREMDKFETMLKQSESNKTLYKTLKAEQDKRGIASAGTYRTIGYVSLILAIGFLAFLVVTFLKNDKLRLIVAGSVLALNLILVMMSPGGDYSESKYNSTPSTRKIALITLGIGVVGIVTGLGRNKVGQKTQKEVAA
ncbi:hypothetical protein BKI52_16365 [marine bacterium AO1-C]|nr:hypothetical protein BKI52_16365 [marine bacterium AO1-C]